MPPTVFLGFRFATHEASVLLEFTLMRCSKKWECYIGRYFGFNCYFAKFSSSGFATSSEHFELLRWLMDRVVVGGCMVVGGDNKGEAPPWGLVLQSQCWSLLKEGDNNPMQNLHPTYQTTSTAILMVWLPGTPKCIFLSRNRGITCSAINIIQHLNTNRHCHCRRYALFARVLRARWDKHMD